MAKTSSGFLDYVNNQNASSGFLDYVNGAPTPPAPTLPKADRFKTGAGREVNDILTGVGIGTMNLPSAVTGLADIPAGYMGFDRPFSHAADAIGEATGFQPHQLAKNAAAGYSPETLQAGKTIDAAWQDPNTGALDIAKAYYQNPRAVGRLVAESLPSTLAGGGAGAALRATGAIGKGAVAGSAEATAANILAGGVGEGALMAGQAMSDINPEVDPRTAALIATGIGAAGGAIGAYGGKLVEQAGLGNLETALASGGISGAGSSALSLPRRVVGSSLAEGGEEAAQSTIETTGKNLAEGKPLTQDLARNVVEGTLAGNAMGAAAGLASTEKVTPATGQPVPEVKPDSGPLTKAVNVNAVDIATPDVASAIYTQHTQQPPTHETVDSQPAWQVNGEFLDAEGNTIEPDFIRPPGNAPVYDPSAGTNATQSQGTQPGTSGTTGNRPGAQPEQPRDTTGSGNPALDEARTYVDRIDAVLSKPGATGFTSVTNELRRYAQGQGVYDSKLAPNDLFQALKAKVGGAATQNDATATQNDATVKPMAYEDSSGNRYTPTEDPDVFLDPDGNEWVQNGDIKPVSSKIDDKAHQAATSPLNDRKEPSQGQKDAGNYKKGHVTLQGLPITIENPAGSERKGVDPDGKPWSVTMSNHYGYIKRTEGADGDQVDVFIGNNPDSQTVYIVNQNDPKTGEFDEHKIMLGFDSQEDAIAAYKSNYAADWQGMGAVGPMRMENFKKAMQAGEFDKPIKAKKFDTDLLTPSTQGQNVSMKPGNVDTPKPQTSLYDEEPGLDTKQALADLERQKDAKRQGGGSQAEPPPLFNEYPDLAGQQDLTNLTKPAGQPGNVPQNEQDVSHETIEIKNKAPRKKPSVKSTDELSVAVRKLGGIQYKDHADRAGFSDFKEDRFMFHNGAGAKTLDEMAEALREVGFNEIQGENDLIQKLYDSLREIPHYTPDGWMRQQEIMARDNFDDEQARAYSDIEDALDDGLITDDDIDAAIASDSEDDFEELITTTLSPEEAEAFWNDTNTTTAAGSAASNQATQPGKETGAGSGAGAAAGAAKDAELAAQFANNKIFTADKVEAARARLRAKLGTLNSGFDPELALDGLTIAGAYIESGVKTFAAYSKAMVEDFGDKIKPYLLSFYEGARAYPGIDKTGMTPQDQAAKEHQALLTPAVLEQVKDAVGVTPEVKPVTKTSQHRFLKADWGVEHIDGYTKIAGGKNQETDYGLKGGVKDAFLDDAKKYLYHVAMLLQEQGYTPYNDHKGKPLKPISVNESGPATSGDVSLTMRNGEFGVYVTVGDSTLRGVGGFNHPQGVSVMLRYGFNRDGSDKYLGGAGNNWIATNKSSAEIARLLLEKGREFDIKPKTEDKPAQAKQAEKTPKADTTPQAKLADLEAELAKVKAKIKADFIGEKPDKDLRDKLLRQIADIKYPIESRFLPYYFLDEQAKVIHEIFANAPPGWHERPFDVTRELANYLDKHMGDRWYANTLTDNIIDAYIEAATKKTDTTPTSPAQVFADKLLAGESFQSIIQARKALTDAKIESGTVDAKKADEDIELAGVIAARKIVEQGGTPEEIFDKLVKLAEQMPALNVRSSTSVIQQAYSTPLPLAFVAAVRAGITKETSNTEPTAGNGALLITADPAKTLANELNPDRAKNLEAQGFEPLSKDAATFNFGIKDSDRVIANPPFGAVKDDDGYSKVFQVNDQYKTSEIDHAISINVLKAMADDGRAVLIVGAPAKTLTEENRSNAYNGKAKRAFYYTLYNEYNVTDHFTVSGDLYARQGASWPVDMIVIEGRGKSALALPAAALPRKINTLEELRHELQKSPGNLQSDRGTAQSDADGRTGLDDAGNDAVSGRSGAKTSAAPGRSSDVLRGTGTASNPSRPGYVPDSGTGRDTEARQPRRDNNPPRKVENKFQAPYTPASQSPSVDTLVPVNMQSAINDALKQIEQDSGGDIDDYVAKMLDYKTSDISKYFSAEQVDAIALALRNIESGKGFIIGDQTGVGKGRVNAAMIRYAIKNEITPIFVSEKPNLYGDMIRDLNDIGMPDIKPFMTNTGESIPLDDDAMQWFNAAEDAKAEGKRPPPRYGRFIKTQGGDAHKKTMQGLLDAGRLEGFDVIFTTYNQMQTVKGERTLRMDMLSALGDGGLLILDESHNAGGTEVSGFRKKPVEEGEKTGRAAFVRHLVGIAKGVFYSSATYAKRPEVLDLYSKTDMGLVADPNKLKDALIAGGVPLQQAVAAMLAKAGQYIRREKSFDGIRYDTEIATVDRRFAENASTIMREIMKFDELKKLGVKAVADDAKGAATNVTTDRSTGGAGATSTNFTSVMHNMIAQMLLMMKVQPAIDQALAALANGEKPVITLSNTMGSAIEEYAEEVGLKPGDAISLNFGDLLKRYLMKSRRILVKDAFGRSESRLLTDAELGPHAVAFYRSVIRKIDEMGFDQYPVSPVDAIHAALAKAGYKSDEITGRGVTVDYSGDMPVFKRRSGGSLTTGGKRKIISDFNNGRLDVIVLNQSGATGLSLHSSPKEGGDTRPRVMIIAQAELNIDTHMQMLGRINRTGQINLPRYVQLVADIAAEKRPAAILAKKMAMLNANTTAGKDSAVKAKDVPDFMNKYGDEIAAAAMLDNDEIHKALGEPLSASDTGEGYATEDAMRKVTGRIPVLTLADQERLYDEIEEAYNDYIDTLNKTGQNELEAESLPLDAKTISREVVIDKSNATSDSPFAEGVTALTVDAKNLGRPYTLEQIAVLLEKEGITEDPQSKIRYRDNLQSQILEEYRKLDDQWKEELTGDEKADKWVKARRETLELRKRTLYRTANMKPGTEVTLVSPSGAAYAAIAGGMKKKGSGNYFALSQWKMTVYVADAAKSFTIPITRIAGSTTNSKENEGKWLLEDPLFDVKSAFEEGLSESREQRIILEGNMLAAYGFDESGRIVNYTDDKGEVKQGILMPKRFNLEEAKNAQPVEFTSPQQALAFTQSNDGIYTHLRNASSEIKIAINRNDATLAVPASRAKGGAIFTNTRLVNLLGDFYKRGNEMQRNFPLNKLAAVLEIIYPITGPLQPTSKLLGREFLEKQKPGYTGNKVNEPGEGYDNKQGGLSAPGRKRGKRQPATAGNLSTARALSDTGAPETGTYATQTALSVDRKRELSVSHINNPKQAAQAAFALANQAVERFDAFVTDKDGVPLAIVGAFKGAVAEASVYPSTVIAEAFRIPGAAHIWFTHNHPSGNATLSKADIGITSRLQKAFDGSSITAHGILALTPDGNFSYRDPATDEDEKTGKFNANPPKTGKTVKVIERLLAKTDKLGPGITGADLAKTVIPKVSGNQTGMVLLNNANEPVGFLPFPAIKAGLLKTTGSMDAIYRAVSMTNAKAVIINDPSSDYTRAEYQNIGTFLDGIDIKLLDVVQGETTASERGESFVRASRTFYSKGNTKQGMSAKQLESALPGWAKKLQQAGKLEIRTDGPALVEGAYQNGKITLFANNLSVATLPSVLRHEAFHWSYNNDATTQAAVDRFKTFMENRLKQARNGKGTAIEKAALQRLEASETPLEAQLEEFQAYLISQWQTKPDSLLATIARAIQDFIAAIRASLLRLGVPLKELTPADLSALAKMGARIPVSKAGIPVSKDATAKRSAKAQRFYSALKRMITNAPDKVFGNGKQVAAWLESNAAKFGVKADEIYWSGITDFLKNGDKIDRNYVLSFLDANGVQVNTESMEQFPETAATERGYLEDQIASIEEELDALGEPFEDDYLREPDEEDGEVWFDDDAWQEDWASHRRQVKELEADLREKQRELKNFDESDYDDTKYAKYTIPGGKPGTYRETLLTLPVKPSSKYWAEEDTVVPGHPLWRVASRRESDGATVFTGRSHATKERAEQAIREMENQKTYHSSHWNSPNVIAHYRTDERLDADGNRVLFLNEIQSDWAAEGRKKGFAKPFTPDMPMKANLEGMGNGITWEVTTEDGRFITNVSPGDFLGERAINTDQYRAITEQEAITVARRRLMENPQRTANNQNIPPAPFVTDTKAYVALALKHAISQAVDAGIGKVAIISGAQAADIYDLSKQVKEIIVSRVRGGLRGVDMVDINGNRYEMEVNNDTGIVVTSDYPQFRDKPLDEVVGKELAKKILEDEGRQVLKGVDLRVGGEGMKAFYDKIVPSVMRDIAKRMGGEVEPVEFFGSPSSKGGFGVKFGATYQPGITITPAMRDKVLNEGMPLFSKKPSLRDSRTANTLGDIRYSIAAPGPHKQPPAPKQSKALLQRWLNSLPQDKLDTAIWKYQNRLIKLKRQMQKVVRNGGQIFEQNDPYLQEELYHQRSAHRIKQFYKDELGPVLEGLHKNKISLETFQKYLHARHAPERNAEMAKRNPNQKEIDRNYLAAKAEYQRVLSGTINPRALADAKAEIERWQRARPYKGTEDQRLALSGLSNNEAAAYIRDHETPAMKALAAKIDEINNKTLDLTVDYGMEKPGFAAKLKQQYQYYVPLYRDEAHPESFNHPLGRGFSVRGTGMKSAIGSTAEVTNILAHIAQQREQYLRRGEKNAVAVKLASFVLAHPDPDFAEVGRVPMVRQLVNGLVENLPDPLYKSRDNVIMLRQNSRDVGIVFNDNDPEIVRLALSLKNLDGAELDFLEATIAKGTRWLAAVNTSFSIPFGVVNFLRDAEGAMLNLSTTPLKGKQKQVGKHLFGAMKAIYGVERGHKKVDPKYKTYYEAFNKHGGTTGYAQMWDGINQRMAGIEKELAKYGEGDFKKAGRAIVQWLQDYNAVMENSVRLATFIAGVESGLSMPKSASLAKNISVNFNRKGAATTKIGAWYAFFNASMQGSARMLETLRGPTGRTIMMGGVALGILSALAGMLGMDDEEYEKIPDFVRARSLIIPLGKNAYFSMPMPLGFNVFSNLGRTLAEMAFGSGKHSPQRKLLSLASDVTGAFNPLGGSDVVSMLTPTTLDPAIALYGNKDWTGRSIYQPDFNTLDPTPGFKRTKDNASLPSKLLAEGVNKVTGGTDYIPGLLSPTPDQIDYLFGQLFGGTGRELLKTGEAIESTFTGEELATHKIPLLGRLYGSTVGASVDKGIFYDNLTELNQVNNQVQGLYKEGKRNEARVYQQQHPEHLLYNRAAGIQTLLKKLKQQKELNKKQGRPTANIEKLINLRMQEFNREMARKTQ